MPVFRRPLYIVDTDTETDTDTDTAVDHGISDQEAEFTYVPDTPADEPEENTDSFLDAVVREAVAHLVSRDPDRADVLADVLREVTADDHEDNEEHDLSNSETNESNEDEDDAEEDEDEEEELDELDEAGWHAIDNLLASDRDIDYLLASDRDCDSSDDDDEDDEDYDDEEYEGESEENLEYENVYQWSFKPTPKYYHTSPDYDLSRQFFFGFELEVAPIPDHAYPYMTTDTTDWLRKFPWLYCKRDSSLPHQGIEIVSHPFTMDWFELRRNSFIELLEGLERLNYCSHNDSTCGYHIHISKAPYGNDIETAETLMGQMIYQDWYNFAKFSRRNNFHYCVPPDLSEEIKEPPCQYQRRKIRAKMTEIRNRPVNVRPDNTIEIRLWRGTLLPQTFFATLQLTSNLAEWMRKRVLADEIDITNTGLKTIVDYKHYPELEAYYQKRIVMQ
jgi:hypothetical protein